MSLSDPTTATGLTIGTAATSFPLWSTVTGSYQFAVAALGIVVLILTIRKLWFENRIASRKLRDLERGE